MILYTLLCCLAAISPILTETVYDVTKYGADNHARNSMTYAVQKAIDTAASRGGGTVYFPPGQYISGPIRLRSNIKVHFANNVVITWSYDERQYPPVKMQYGKIGWDFKNTPLIYAYGEKNITIRGRGKLEGQGSHWWPKYNSASDRPAFIVFFECQHVLLEDFTVQNSPCMNIRTILSHHITIKGVTIYNPYNGHNTDGINVYSTNHLTIDGVTISTGDDNISIDSGLNYATTNVLITNSHMKWGHAGVCIGGAILGGIRNITVTNTVFDGTDRGLYIKARRGLGNVVDNVQFSNITMNNIVKEGIVLSMVYSENNQDATLHNKNIPYQQKRSDTPVYRNIHYNGVRGNSKLNSVFIVGLPESHVMNVDMKNINVKSSQPIYVANAQNVMINGKKYA